MTSGPDPTPRPLPAATTQRPDPVVGRTVAGRYRIEEHVARGGMARVYRARDERLEREVALKVLSPPYSDDPEFTARFLAEARAAASVSHAGLVHVYDSGSDGPLHFMVMELLKEHRSLREMLDERGRLPAIEAVELARGLLAGLRAVHERGLVHCDVKSSNVMVGPVGPKLIDFGIARTPHAADEGETSMGSLGYIAPEQLSGEPVTPSSDLFGVGVVLYEAITGRLPYPGRDPAELAAAHDAQQVRPPSTIVPGVPPRLDAAMLQALRRDPAARFLGAAAMDRALEASVAELDAEATQIVRRPPAAVPGEGYVPPILPPRQRTRAPPRHQQPAPEPAPWPESRTPLARLAGTAALLAVAVLVVLVIVIPLIESGRDQGGGGADASPPPGTEAPPAGETVSIPSTVGMTRDEAIAAADAVGLNWRLECNHDEARPEGVVDQEPAAGTEVRRGARFTMYSARIEDCR